MKGESAIQLAQLKLTGTDYRVLLVLIGVCAWANQAHITRKQLQESLLISRRQVWQSLKTLQQVGLIIADPEDPSAFSLHPGVCWKASPDGWSGAIARFTTDVRCAAQS